MARTGITPQSASGGATITFEAANVDGNSYRPARGRTLHVINGSGASVTVTVPTPGTTGGGNSIGDKAVAVAAGAQAAIALGPVPVEYLQTGGEVNVDYSAVTSVTVAVVDG